ncbi:MAG: DUF4906 domain-containing protein [Bacteroidales bacterium]|nr:DUF4906 domain-containing protein [Bacteroidales bacterium]
MKRVYFFTILFMMSLLMGIVSCEPYEVEQLVDKNIPEGETTLSAKVTFNSFKDALIGSTKSAGDAIRQIEGLALLVYDKEGKFLQSQYFSANQLAIEDVERNPSDTGEKQEDGTTDRNNAESTTPQATFNFTIPYGIYSIYVVANMGDIANDNNYKDQVQTIEGLRNISFNWVQDKTENPTNISRNNQMFGYFTAGASNTNGEQITINKEGLELHAWLKRAVSKVTVAFNGEGLNENIRVTVKSVQIKDIPVSCLLDADNIPDADNEILANGEIISYADAQGEFPVITKGGVIFGANHYQGWREADGSTFKDFDPKGENGASHLESSPALYFYENLQGIAESGSTADKSLNKLEYTQKGKKYGTYIEVKGYYENQNMGSVTSGEIIYRFMLGKNVTTNYDAERNHHYKVTLCFKNDANDVDWRIEYNENTGIYVPNPYYISYLYNQSTQLPMKVVIPEDDQIASIKAEIIENNWEPSGDVTYLDTYYGNNSDTKDIYKATGEGGAEVIGKTTEGNTDAEWIGFLSLVDEAVVMNGVNSTEHNISLEHGLTTFTKYLDDQVGYPYLHWTGNCNCPNPAHLGLKEDYYENAQEYGFTGYETTGTNTISASFQIPFYTRTKQLFRVTGFVGNNPYYTHDREAKVQIVVKTKNGNEYSNVVKIIQVRRLINPTGIWRSHNNAESFNVTLMNMSLEAADSGVFSPLISDGPWTAKVIRGQDWVLLNGKLGNIVTGSTGTSVQFTYKPNGTIGQNEVRCGIIEVYYHNNSCVHRIFVRQGYAPYALANGEAQWYTFNMNTQTSMTASPLDEGSLFRYGKPEYPISEVNNLDPLFSYAVNPGSNPLAIEGSTTPKTWSEIGSLSRTAAFEFSVDNARLPYLSEYDKLLNYDNGYGVLYGDGATEVATTSTEAFAYRKHAPISQDKLKKRGMRGIFVYNESNGGNLFFPIGAVGHGHRKHHNLSGISGQYGILRYATANVPIESPYRPLLYNLFSQYGALYWTGGESDGYTGDAWDINFNQLDFNEYSYSNAFATSYNSDGTSKGNGKDPNLGDACYVRCVVGTR